MPTSSIIKNHALSEVKNETLACGVGKFGLVKTAAQLLQADSDHTAGERGFFPLSPAVKLEHAPPARFGMVGTSDALHTTSALMQKAARSEASILLHGESGTGKELAAKAIHAHSPRAACPLLPVDCTALPENLLEAELFGYEKGAFTGALTAKPGLMEMADGGTLFLDEVGELPIGLQPKLLRALQEKEYRRVGGTRTMTFDARIVAATNRDLSRRVKEGEFRDDLFFRLNVIPIQLPPLRERYGDVRLLANWFLQSYCERDTGMTKSFDEEVLQIFDSYPWPGNIRELQNVVRRMSVLSEGPLITTRDLPAEISQPPGRSSDSFQEKAARFESGELAFGAAKNQYLSLFEASYLRNTLDRHGGNVSRAAETAGIDRKTFYRLLRKHQMAPEKFRGH
jgi:DNA-binding NtrC family response regulator